MSIKYNLDSLSKEEKIELRELLGKITSNNKELLDITGLGTLFNQTCYETNDSTDLEDLNNYWKGEFVHLSSESNGNTIDTYCYVNSIEIVEDVTVITKNPIILVITEGGKKRYSIQSPISEDDFLVVSDILPEFIKSKNNVDGNIARETYETVYKAMVDYFGVLWQSV